MMQNAAPLPNLKLISHRLCPYVQRARIVLNEKAIPHDIEFIDLNAKPDWFLRLSPLGKVPLLLVDGEPIFESAVISEYLDEITPGSLHPADPLTKAKHRAWIEFASSILAAIAALYNAPDTHAFDRAVTVLRERFRSVASVILARPYFGGERFQLVDAAFGPVFRYFDVIDRHVDFGFFAETPRLADWRNAVSARPSVEGAVVDDYPQRLHQFLARRESVLGSLIDRAQPGPI